VSVESLHSGQQLVVVSDIDEDLGICLDSGVEKGKGAGCECVWPRGCMKGRFSYGVLVRDASPACVRGVLIGV